MSFSSSSIPSPEDIGEEMQKYVQLTRIFFCKIIECVYSSRCPKELSDFTEDEEAWFSVSIPKSLSLRQLVSRRTDYGWFQIDVILTDPDVVLERWVLLHEPSDFSASRPLIGTSRSDLRRHVFRRFSQVLRSIYAMLNVLPTKTLEFALSQITVTRRRITAVCSHFMSLPARDFRDDDRFMTVFGPVTTPLGRCAITCYSLKDVLSLTPKILSVTDVPPTTQVNDSIAVSDDDSWVKVSASRSSDNDWVVVDSQMSESGSQNDGSSWVSAPGRPESESAELVSEFVNDSYTEMGPELVDDEETEMSVDDSTPEEFIEKLNSQNLVFEDLRSIDDLKKVFEQVSREVDILHEDWLSTSG